ncbi:MAG: hypothetical protein LBB31_04020, partial [Prevotellaceae bacterium]|nr:hypothetical protein [Prevotellaceae bacterium]
MKKLLKIFLSLSKGERTGLAALLVLLAAFQVTPYIFSSHHAAPDFSTFKKKIDSLSLIFSTGESEMVEVSDVAYNPKRYVSAQTPPPALFAFDPNTAGVRDFEQLGFSPKQAATIV